MGKSSAEHTATEVYVHVPKTAGSSLRQALIDRHGAKSVYVYSTGTDRLVRVSREVGGTATPFGIALREVLGHMPDPLVSSVVSTGLKIRELSASSDKKVLSKAAAVIGHFPVNRFANVETAEQPLLRTVVREPLARMVSHYRHVTSPSHMGVTGHYTTWATGHSPNLEFKDFALDDSVRNFQTGYTGTDITRFELVGTTENFDRFLGNAGLIGFDEEVPHVNKAHGGAIDARLLADSGFIRDFREFHAADYAFYEAAVSLQS